MADTTDILNSIRDAELALGGATGLEDAMSYEALEELLKEQIPVPRRKPESLEEIREAWREDDEQKLFEQLTRAQNIARLKRQLDADAGPLTDEVERVVVGASDMTTPPPPEQLLLGASSSDANGLGPDGALANITDSDAYKFYTAAYDELYPEQAPRSKWEDALYFFLNMAAKASEPGATALGAAGAAGKATVDQMRELRKDQRAADLLKKRDLLSAVAAERLFEAKPQTMKLYINPETQKREWLTDAQLNDRVSSGKADNLVEYTAPKAGTGSIVNRFLNTVEGVLPALRAGEKLTSEQIVKLGVLAREISEPTTRTYTDADGNTVTETFPGVDIKEALRGAGEEGVAILRQIFPRDTYDVVTEDEDPTGTDVVTEDEDPTDTTYAPVQIRVGDSIVTSTIVSKTKFSEGVAKLITNMESGSRAVHKAYEALFDLETVDGVESRVFNKWTAATAHTFEDKSVGKPRKARVAMKQALEIILRARSGAAIPPEELENYIEMYMPSFLDDDELARDKIHALGFYFDNTIKLIEQGRNIPFDKDRVVKDWSSIMPVSAAGTLPKAGADGTGATTARSPAVTISPDTGKATFKGGGY